MSARKAPSKVIPSKLSKSSLSSTSTTESLKSSLNSLSTIEKFAGKNYEQLVSNDFQKELIFGTEQFLYPQKVIQPSKITILTSIQ